MKTIAFFNNKGGVGKTTLVYHVSAMFAELGLRVLAVDLDPQANLTSMCVNDDEFEGLWPQGAHSCTLLGAVQPIIDGTGDIHAVEPYPIAFNPRLGLLPGDLGLTVFEDELALAWPRVVDRRIDSLRSTTAFARVISDTAGRWEADVILIDVGPNLGALNRAALICAEHVVVPLAPDLFSLQGLRNLGPTLRAWRREWRDRRERNVAVPLTVPEGAMNPLGYVVAQHAFRANRPVMAYNRWLEQIPSTYRRYVLDLADHGATTVDEDDNRLASLKNYHSLAPLAMEARKPMFALRPGDGALGAQMYAVRSCYDDFHAVTTTIANRLGIVLPVINRTAK
jgi:chromosome partitioning protein